MGRHSRIDLGTTDTMVSARGLFALEKTAEDYPGETATDAVAAPHEATKDAGPIAALDVKRIVNAPARGGGDFAIRR